jgi:hypothetical protein
MLYDTKLTNLAQYINKHKHLKLLHPFSMTLHVPLAVFHRLLHFVNIWWMVGYIVEQCNTAAVMCTFKAKEINICNNYKIKSLLNLCTKYWQEQFKSLQLIFLLEKQGGFRKGHKIIDSSLRPSIQQYAT